MEKEEGYQLTSPDSKRQMKKKPRVNQPKHIGDYCRWDTVGKLWGMNIVTESKKGLQRKKKINGVKHY